MSKSRAEEIADLTPEDQRRYWTYRSWAIFAGVVSLFSFWIMVLLHLFIPGGGGGYGLGGDARLIQWAPFGVIFAIGCLVISSHLGGRAKDIRNPNYQSNAESKE